VITTAAVPGRPAPLLISAHTVASMRPGSVVVDLAAESGGNVEGSQPGAQVRIGGTLVWGATDVPSQLPLHASALYSANVEALLRLITAEGSLHVDLSDEVLDGCVVVHRGLVRDRAAADALGLQPVSAAPAPDEPATPPEPTDAAPADPASPDAPGEGA
jgi:NAD(P) transhydrogenase subunit alpha